MSEAKARSYIAVLRDGRTVGYYMNTPPRRNEATQDYVCVTIPTLDAASARELQWRGFRFAERNIVIEIPLRRFRSPLSFGGGQIPIDRCGRLEPGGDILPS